MFKQMQAMLEDRVRHERKQADDRNDEIADLKAQLFTAKREVFDARDDAHEAWKKIDNIRSMKAPALGGLTPEGLDPLAALSPQHLRDFTAIAKAKAKRGDDDKALKNALGHVRGKQAHYDTPEPSSVADTGNAKAPVPGLKWHRRRKDKSCTQLSTTACLLKLAPHLEAAPLKSCRWATSRSWECA